MTFTEIANNIGVMYLLLIIAFALVYIAFGKKESSKKSSRSRS